MCEQKITVRRCCLLGVPFISGANDKLEADVRAARDGCGGPSAADEAGLRDHESRRQCRSRRDATWA